jgi:hypothetical protein
MPVLRVIDRERRFVHVTWTGQMTPEALRDSAAELITNPEFAAYGRSLSDLRLAQIDLLGADISSIFAGTIRPNLPAHRWRIALLVEGKFQYGMCRQFLTYTESKIDGEIFTDEAAAIAWLTSDN